MGSYSLEIARVNQKKNPIIDSGDTVVTIGTCLTSTFNSYFSSIGVDSILIPTEQAMYSSVSIANLLDFCLGRAQKLENYYIEDEDGGIRFLPFGLKNGFLYDSHKDLSDSLISELPFYTETLKKAATVVVFLGTCRVVRSIEHSCVINRVGCLSQHSWTSDQMSASEINVTLKKIINNLNQLNPEVNIIFAIDPQRYLFNFCEDKVADNYLSKAKLLASIDDVINHFENVYYFKSLEIVYEELRHIEYINYGDLTHVNTQTVKYIFDIFVKSFCIENVQSRIEAADVLELAGQFILFANADKFGKAQLKNLNCMFDHLLKLDADFNLIPDHNLNYIATVAKLCGRDDIMGMIKQMYLEKNNVLLGKTFYIWGAGGRSEKTTYSSFLYNNVHCLGFIDNDSQKHGLTFCGKTVFPPAVLNETCPDLVIINSAFNAEISAQLDFYWPDINYISAT